MEEEHGAEAYTLPRSVGEAEVSEDGGDDGGGADGGEDAVARAAVRAAENVESEGPLQEGGPVEGGVFNSCSTCSGRTCGSGCSGGQVCMCGTCQAPGTGCN
jgi:hypothetical protein